MRTRRHQELERNILRTRGAVERAVRVLVFSGNGAELAGGVAEALEVGEVLSEGEGNAVVYGADLFGVEGLGFLGVGGVGGGGAGGLRACGGGGEGAEELPARACGVSRCGLGSGRVSYRWRRDV